MAAEPTTTTAAPRKRKPAKKTLDIVSPDQVAPPTFDMGLTPGQAASTEWNTETERYRAAEAARHYIDEIEVIEALSIGTWMNKPPGTENWNYVRAGIQGHARAVAMATSLRRKGYVRAAPQVRCLGFEAEGSDGLYLCCPPEVHANIKAAKGKLRKARKANINQHFDKMLRGAHRPGVSVDTFDV